MACARISVVCFYVIVLATFVSTDFKVAPPKVQLTVFMESLCPDCQRFLHEQLGPVYPQVADILDLEFVPYGNAEEVQNPDGTWNFTCQHGPRECVGNMVETCALRLIPEMKEVFPFIMCLEESNKPDTLGPECAKEHGIDYNPIQSCLSSDLGNQWQHDNAVRTNNLQPPHTYVPWVLLNGVHTEDIEKKAESQLLKLICDTYTGKPPPACNESWEEVTSNAV